MLLYGILLKIIFHMINAIPCNVNYSKPYETALSLSNYTQVEDGKSLSRESHYSCDLQRLLKSVGENIPLFQHFHGAEGNRSILVCFSRVFPTLSLERRRD